MYQNNYKITEDGFGVHTFELTIKSITRAEFDRIAAIPAQKYYKDYGKKIYIYPEQRGIRVSLNHTEDNIYNIQVVVTPRRLIDESADEIAILRAMDNLEILKEKINDVLTKHLGADYNIDKFNVSRIDCCVNVMFSEDFSAKRYIKLIRRSMKYNPYAIIQRFPNEDTNAKAKNKHSFRVQTGDVTFTAYDKFFQLDDIGVNYRNIKGTLLRLELAFNRDLISEIQKVFPEEIDNIDLIGYFAYISEKEFKKYIRKHFCEGDYYSYSNMIDIIEKSGLNRKIRARMLDYAEMQVCKSNMASAQKEALKYFDTNYKLDKMFDAFKSLGVNPTTLAYRDKHGNKPVPGLYTILGF